MKRDPIGHACTFFGHRDCPAEIADDLRNVLTELIEQQGVNRFYVGNQGSYDAMTHRVLRELMQTHPSIRCHVVLAYLPKSHGEFRDHELSDSIYPEGIELVPQRFAVSWRNRWMLNQSDYVVTYITHSWGGAAKFAQLAKQQHKSICRLGTL